MAFCTLAAGLSGAALVAAINSITGILMVFVFGCSVFSLVVYAVLESECPKSK